jgi:putative flippase GtrA
MKEVIRQSLRFGTVGLVNTAIGLTAIYAVLYFFEAGPVVANAIGYAIGLVVSFSFNRSWTFGDTTSATKALPRYLILAAISYLLNLFTVVIGTRVFSIGPYIVQLVGLGTYTAAMFLGCRWFVFSPVRSFRGASKNILALPLVAAIPFLLGGVVLDIPRWDLSVPLIYGQGDETWQLVLTKALRDTGWVLSNPFLGAPDIASWHHHAAAQTSALHSVLMLAISLFIDDAVKIQQVYYLLNFPLITLTSFVACRLLGVAQLPAFCVGVLFAFTTYRIDGMLYAFLSNYFMVPLALVSVLWIMTGVFRRLPATTEGTSDKPHGVRRILLSKEFLLGLLFIVLMALSDGYYAFFTLLLLAFAMSVRIVSGDLKSPASLLPPTLYIVSLIGVSLALSWPLYVYKKTHIEEFFPNGVQDSVLVKHAFEAEVYSTTLKMLVAPSPTHRIEPMARVGKWMVATSDAARSFKNERNLVPLGTLGSILFGMAMIWLAVPLLRKRASAQDTTHGDVNADGLDNALLSLTFFIFLCSILGGIGTLIALVFPTIRAYDRFPLFLIFVLFLGGALLASRLLRKATSIRRLGYSTALIFITAAALYDQIPRNLNIGDPLKRGVFLAERDFVKTIEASLPKRAMVYQYPYSQYLRNSKYYGWGAFSHVRLYLHSSALRWSNGAAKNSAVENWHLRLTALPVQDLLTEIKAAGFVGVVVDRTVVPQSEYERLRKALKDDGAELLEDGPSRLAFARLKDSGFRIEYDVGYREAVRLIITDRSSLPQRRLSYLIDEQRLRQVLAQQPAGSNDVVIEKSVHPQVFLDASALTKGMGVEPIRPLTDMRGEVRCTMESGAPIAKASDTVVLTLENRSAFDWKFDTGPYPIRIGVHMRRLDGTMLRWDDGLRVPTAIPGSSGESLSIPRGSSGQVHFRLSHLHFKGLEDGHQDLVADFRMVQDGHAWFEELGCKVIVRN